MTLIKKILCAVFGHKWEPVAVINQTIGYCHKFTCARCGKIIRRKPIYLLPPSVEKVVQNGA